VSVCDKLHTLQAQNACKAVVGNFYENKQV